MTTHIKTEWKMDFFLIKHTLPKLHQEVENLPGSIPGEEIGKGVMKPT